MKLSAEMPRAHSGLEFIQSRQGEGPTVSQAGAQTRVCPADRQTRRQSVCFEGQEVDPVFSDMSLYEVIDRIASQYPHRPALQFMGKITSFKEMSEKISASASEFERRGISRGDCVAVCAPNCPQAVFSLYALNKIGAVAVLLNPLLPAGQLLRQMKDTGCKGLVIPDILVPKLLKECRMAKICIAGFIRIIKLTDEMSSAAALRYKLLLSFRLMHAGIYTRLNPAAMSRMFCGPTAQSINGISPKQDCGSPYSLGQTADRLFDTFLRYDPSPAKRPAVIIFSGGTSGSPKPVIHSSESINLSAMQCLSTEPPIEEGMSMLTVLPIFHIYGLIVALHLALLAGGRCILLPRYTAGSVVEVLIKCKPTYMAGVPAIYSSLLNSKYLKKAEKAGRLDFQGFRLGFCGGDKLDAATLNGFNKMIRYSGGSGRIVDGYGLTECCPVTVMPRNGSGPEGSIGKAFPGIELCIADSEACVHLQCGETGEICIHARNTMLRYHSSSSDLSEAFRLHSDGKLWLHTGDIGKLDEEGFLFLSSRLRRIIKVSGYSVFPSYLEEALTGHPGISKAAVIAENEGTALVKIKAYIVLNPDYFKPVARLFPGPRKLRCASENKARRQILEYCHQKLAPWAIPKTIEFKTSLPVNMLGKTAYGQLDYGRQYPDN